MKTIAPLALATLVLSALFLLTGSGTKVSWINEIKSSPVLDPRTFGAICDGNTANASVDTAGIQAAIDAAPSTVTANPTEVHVASGTCVINATIKLRRNSLLFTGVPGAGALADSSFGFSIPITAQGTRFIPTSTFDGPMFQIDPADVQANNGQISSNVRGTSIRNIQIDVGAATSNGHFLSNPVILTRSLVRPPEWLNITIWNHVASCFVITPAVTQTPTNANPYPPEHIHIVNLQCLSSGSVGPPTAPGLLIEGADQVYLDRSQIAAQVQGTVNAPATCPVSSGSGTCRNDVPAIEIRSFNYGLLSYNTHITNNIIASYAIAVRIRGADYTIAGANGGSCTTAPTSGGCSVPGGSYHYSPNNVILTDNHVEGYNRFLVLNDESTNLTRTISYDVFFDTSNTAIGPFFGGSGSTPLLRADVDHLSGGTIDIPFYEGVSGPYIKIGSDTQGISSRVPIFVGTSSGLPIFDAGGNNRVTVITGRLAFSQLPLCRNSSCGLPNTDAPRGTLLPCSDCSCPVSTVCSSGGGYRGIISDGTQWVGQ